MSGPRGVRLLHDPVRNKGTAFTEQERELLGLHGLLPPRVFTQDLQVQRVMENLRRKPDDLERYVQLIGLQDRNETLFYRVLLDHLEELMPVVYTPTVGKACEAYGHIFRRPRGLFLTADDRGRVREVLRNWPHEDVRMIVVTDGGRILGLGDLGADGMGIPIGKLTLYTVCAGLPPTQCLPITLDVGTDNQELRDDPLYIGQPRSRLRGAAYDELVEEFVGAVQEVFPRAVLQLEDFATREAFTLLARYRDRCRLFDDDIQGTAAVVLAGLYSAHRITGQSLAEGRYLFYGAGEAAIGSGQLLVAALGEAGLDERQARERCWFLDSKGLVTRDRPDLPPHKAPFARDGEGLGVPPDADLETLVNRLRPTALIGASGVPGSFTRPVLEAMARHNEHPVVFALSNPTSRSECTAEQAYAFTDGRAVFASGSPFEPVIHQGQRRVPGQGNNVYIFPGLGLGVVLSQARRVSDRMFLVAARTLASQVTDADLREGRIFPALRQIRDVSLRIAIAVIGVAVEEGVAEADLPDDLEAFVRARMFEPTYASLEDSEAPTQPRSPSHEER